MLRGLLRGAVLLIVAAMLTGHVTELFDHWDHTLRTGRDADYPLVVIAACIGLGFVAAKSLIVLTRERRGNADFAEESTASLYSVVLTRSSILGPSPPLAVSLRI